MMTGSVLATIGITSTTARKCSLPPLATAVNHILLLLYASDWIRSMCFFMDALMDMQNIMVNKFSADHSFHECKNNLNDH